MTPGDGGYRREDWFGPESFAGAIVGLAVISIPYVSFDAREFVWLIALPLLAGIALAVFGGRARRFGAGLVAGFVGLPLTIVGLVVGAAIGHALGA